MPWRNPHSLNTLLIAHVREGNPTSTWRLFSQMHQAGNHLDGYTFTPVLTACSMTTNTEQGKQVHALLAKSCPTSGTVVGTALVNMYAKCGHLGDAIRAFDEVRSKDTVAWNALLSGFAQNGFVSGAVSVFQSMLKHGVEISEYTLCSMLKVCCSANAPRQGEKIHASTIVRGWSDSLVLGTALVDFYSDCQMIDFAIKVFNGLSCHKDDAIHNALVSGCVRNRNYNEVFLILGRMKPNAVALTSALVACTELLDFPVGKQVHCAALRWGFESDTLLCNALLDMYAKCGKMTSARLVFNGIDSKNVVSWTSMIDAYGSHGCGIEALKLFEEMMREPCSISPNSVTFLVVLSACGHSGLVEAARNCFVSMKEKHNIDQSPEHYACFIDLLGRAGKIQEAWDLFYDMKKSDIEPTSAVWAALLNACKVSLDVVRGEFAARHLFELEPKNPAYYVLLSNFYADVGKWEAVEELRRLMRGKGLGKEVGSSWVAHDCENASIATDAKMEVGFGHMK